jgi:hypothetical protein
LLTTTATQVTEVIMAVYFSDCQIVPAFLTIQVAVWVNTC